MGRRELNRVRSIVLAMPEVSERMSHGAICFFVNGRVPLCYYHDNHRGDGRVSLWCPAYYDTQQELVLNQPQRFFKPRMSSAGTFSNWLGAFLDAPGEDSVDWNLIAEVVGDAYRKVAPKKLVAVFERGERT